MKNPFIPILIVIVGLIGCALWIVFAPSAESIGLEPVGQDPVESPEDKPRPIHHSKLSQQELALGFRSQLDPGRNVTLLGHPNSPCWLEIPSAIGSGTSNESPASSTDFVGPQACIQCHAEQYEGFSETAHALTSSLATAETIDGPFDSPKSTVQSIHPDLSFQMIRDDSGHYQEIQLRELRRRIPFDIVTGSGKTAQTYLFWEDDRLFQMHLSYFKPLQSWINSPGYHDGTAWYTRETIPKCVQCHMTYMERKPGTKNSFVKDATIFGVSCERCHGPARQHVDYHQENPSSKTAKFIANPSKLDRNRTNDVCAQCHLGTATPLKAPFSFRPGDVLEEHFDIFHDEDGGSVHTANQLERMELSKCYLQSEEMTCVTCHNPHRNERGDTKLFSQRCQKCHQLDDCGMHSELGASLATNCIDCHMTMGYDDSIQIQKTGEVHMPLLRDHFIRVLPERSKKLLKQLLAK